MSTTNTRPELPALSAAQRLIAAALVENPDATVKVLAEATRTSKSTVAKTLLKLEQAGAARRTLHETGDARLADTWAPTVLTGELLVAAAAEEPGYGHAAAVLSALADGSTVAASEELELNPDIEANGAGASDTTNVPDAADNVSQTMPADAIRVGSEDPDATDEGVLDGGSGDDAAAEGAEDSRSVSDIATAHAELIPAPGRLAAPVDAPSSRERLAPGALGAMVAAHLTAHPEMDFTPTELSRVLGGKSSGAIYNALEKMVGSGAVARTCDKPKRYRLVEARVSTGC